MSKKEYVLDSLFEDIPDEDYNFSWSEHKERVRELLKLGAKGFCGGCLFVLLVLGMVASFSDESVMFADPSFVLLALFGGIGCIGFPYGWSLINRVVGNWSIFGNIIVVLAFFWFKAGFSLMLGIWVYPIVLIYNLIQSQKSKRKIRRAWLIIVALIVAWIMVGGILISLESSGDSNTNNGESIATTIGGNEIADTATSAVKHYAAVDELPMDIVQEIANQLVLEQQKENDEDPNFTYTAVELYGIFFLERKEDAWADENQLHFVIHYNMLDDNGEVMNVYYTPMYIKNIQVQADGRVSLQRDDCAALFFYDSAENYIEEYESNYAIRQIG